VYRDRDSDIDFVLAPLFEPKDFNLMFAPLTLDSYRMDLSQLQDWAILSSQIRADLTQAALELDRAYAERFPEGAVTDKRIDTLVQKRFSHEQAPRALSAHKFVAASEVPIGRKRSRRKQHQLNYAEILGILHSALIDKLSYKDVADLFGVKHRLVSSLVCKSKKNAGFIDSLKAKELAKSENFGRVQEQVQLHLNNRKFILSSPELTDTINAKYAVNLSKTFVKASMKELSLKYKAVNFVPIQANSERCLVLRQQYAVVMLGLLQ
jgi:hypothetical protein